MIILRMKKLSEEIKVKRLIFRIILIILLLWTFSIIFGFSNQNSVESGSLSKKVARKIIDIFPYTKNLSETTKVKIVEKSQPIIRKLAHFSIYTLVGFLIMTFVSTYKLMLWKKWLISIGVGLTYAISDEFHQSFIPRKICRTKRCINRHLWSNFWYYDSFNYNLCI